MMWFFGFVCGAVFGCIMTAIAASIREQDGYTPTNEELLREHYRCAICGKKPCDGHGHHPVPMGEL